jgi:hypothetical protein
MRFDAANAADQATCQPRGPDDGEEIIFNYLHCYYYFGYIFLNRAQPKPDTRMAQKRLGSDERWACGWF